MMEVGTFVMDEIGTISNDLTRGQTKEGSSLAGFRISISFD